MAQEYIASLPSLPSTPSPTDLVIIEVDGVATYKTTYANLTALTDIAITNVSNATSSAQSDAINAQSDATLALSQIATISVLSLQGNGWNALTNTPILSDATGTDLDAYIVNVTGTRNLGSGLNTWTAGTIMYHAGGIWTPGPTFTTITNLDNVLNSTTRKAVTANQLAALTNSPNALSSANPVADKIYVDAMFNAAGSVAVKQFNTIQNYETDGFKSGDGLGRLLSTLGYTNTTIQTKFPNTYALRGGSFTTAWTYDTAVIQESTIKLKYLKSMRLQSEDDRTYVVNKQIILPAVRSDNTEGTNPYMFIYDWGGTAIVDSRTGGDATGGLFYKVPVNSSDANNIDIEYAHIHKNLRVRGQYIIGSYAFEYGSTKRSQFINIDMAGYVIGMYFAQMLSCKLSDLNSFSATTSGVKFTQGWWTGAIPAETVSQPRIDNCRFYTGSATATGLWLENCDSIGGANLQFEGSAGKYGLYYDTLAGASTIKNAMFTNLRFESESKYTNALIGYKSRDGFHFIVELGWHQAVTAGTFLMETEAYDGTNPQVVLSYWDNNGGATAWRINNLNQGTSFQLNHVRLVGSPQNVADILASGTTIFATTMPTSNRLQITPIQPTA